MPGEISRHGFGQVDVRFKDGEQRTINFFVSRLEYSRWVAVSVVEDQSVESCVRAMVHHFDAMGGVPLLAAFDRPKPAGVRSDKDGQVIEWDRGRATASPTKFDSFAEWLADFRRGLEAGEYFVDEEGFVIRK